MNNEKEIIKKNFSRHALHYNKYASIQNIVRDKLIQILGENDINNIKNILELGCGPGNYTEYLNKRFNDSHIDAVDISDDMIAVAQTNIHENNIKFILDDAETMEFDKKYDLITSNATFQWFTNFENAIKKYSKVLNDHGQIVFSVFGPNTFHELSKIIKEVLNKDIKLTASKFLDKTQIKLILEKHFKKIDIEEIDLQKKYKSLLELLRKIKYTGTRGKKNNILNLTKKNIIDIELAYKKEYGDIYTTYDVYICKAEK